MVIVNPDCNCFLLSMDDNDIFVEVESISVVIILIIKIIMVTASFWVHLWWYKTFDGFEKLWAPLN